jgi:hypothetical protein
VTSAGADARIEARFRGRESAIAAAIAILGIAARLLAARGPFRTPDEALHLQIASAPTFLDVYRSSLDNAHPPLFVLLLHAWNGVVHSDWTLRLLPVLFGSLFLWAAWSWARRLLGAVPGLLTLAFAAFLPSIVAVSSELRGYSLLLCLVAAALAALERALDDSSAVWMATFAALGALALLSHYAALRFAAAAFVYSAIRVARRRPRSRRLIAAWGSAFAILFALATFLARTHLARLRGGALEAEVRATWLAESYFRNRSESAATFLGRQTLALFRYAFSTTAAGVIALVLFASGVAILTSRRSPAALLLVLPILFGAAGGLLDLYPYGGTRHSVDLVLFAAAGASLALGRWSGDRRWVAAAVAAALAPAAFLAAG